MKLHTSQMSGSARRAELVAVILGVPIERRQVDLSVAEQRAGLAAINPNAKVPVLEDGDFRLWESRAIMQYLCARSTGQTLYPSEPRSRAEVDRWLFWDAAHLSPAVGPITFERMWKKLIGGGEPDAALIARYERFLHQFAAVLDAQVAGKTWILGESLTIADLSIAATLMYAKPAALPLEGYPHLLAWFARVQAQAAWRSTEPPAMGW